MAKRLEGKVALGTGAGSIGRGWGNGKAVAVLFAREGAKVVALDINADAAIETAAIIASEGGDCTTVTGDVSNSAQVAAAVQTCIDTYGRIDLLHNNVGIVVNGDPVETSEQDWEKGEVVNLKSAFLTSKYTLPHMQAQGGGSIINVSSIAGIRWMGVPYVSYAATKAALLGLSRNIAAQYAPDNIRCNVILPGIIDTPLLRNLLAEIYEGEDMEARIAYRNKQIPMQRMGDAWDVAHAALYLASDEAKYITGAEIPVDGGVSIAALAG
jgi:NAD(P)-dependent dehydrogenase (short-subunit alcohol dehydrogenase family)